MEPTPKHLGDRTGPFRCAYPRCASRREGNDSIIEKLSERVYRCQTCGQLLVACPSPECTRLGVLNRPFGRFCRHCGRPAGQRDGFASDAAVWEAFRRQGWDRAPVRFAGGTLIADCSALPFRAPPRSTRVALALARGFLALHQAGGFVGLARAFSDDTADAWIWAEPDPSPCSEGGDPKAPFDPELLPDGHRFVYATSRSVTVLDVWSCSRLSGIDAVPRKRVVTLGDPSLVLAIPPIPLGAGRIGLLARARDRDRPYHWLVWDLDDPRVGDDEVERRLASAPALPIEGAPCHRHLLEERVVLLATPQGHWAWRLDDAASAPPVPPTRTWTPTPGRGSRVVLDDQVLDSNNLFQPRQAFLIHRDQDSDRPLSFDWFFQLTPDSGMDASVGEILSYNVSLATLATTNASRIVETGTGGEPIGPSRSEAGTPEMIFRFQDEIKRHLPLGGFEPWQRVLPRSVVGLRLIDPLILSVGHRSETESRFYQLDSLLHKGAQARGDLAVGGDPSGRGVKGRTLHCDPLLWSHWLFTVEAVGRDPDDRRLEIRRREVVFAAP